MCDGTHSLIDFLLVRQSFQQLSGRNPDCPSYANHHLARIPNAGYISEGRYTSLFLITISTRRMSLICLVGSPFTRTMPAYLPSAIEPRSWSMCKPVVWYKGFLYQAATWKTARRVVAKVEHHAGELFPRVGFIVTNLNLPSRAVVQFYNKRGTAEQWIKEGKQAVKTTRLSCHRFPLEPSPAGIEPDGLQPGELVVAAGAAQANREVVA